MDRIQRIRDLAETLLGIELLEYHNMNLLNHGNNLGKLDLKKRGIINEIITLTSELETNNSKEVKKHSPNIISDSYELKKVLSLLDELEKEGGDAPHRSVNPCTRITMLVKGEN